MKKAFQMPGADFSSINGKDDLYITAVVHKAFVDVNEEGTEAAAATGVVIGVKSLPPPKPEFRADHPFIFLIRDTRNDSVLFLGRSSSRASDPFLLRQAHGVQPVGFAGTILIPAQSNRRHPRLQGGGISIDAETRGKSCERSR